ncbi:MAG: hypothetical protein ABFD54_13110 [Armatimonadota bacterium]|nr:hypothetical protein [bacterium]
MTNEEARGAYERLYAVLRQHELNWVLNEVDEAIAEGKVVLKDVEEIPEQWIDGTRRRGRRRKVKLLSNIPYTDKEKLELLINAISQALVSPSLMAEKTMKVLMPELGSPDTALAFKRDAAAAEDIPATGPEEEFGMSLSDINKAAEQARGLLAVISQLREEI